MSKKNILFINGIPDDQKMLIQKIDKNGLIKWQGKGGTNLSNFLKNDLFDPYNVVFDLKATQELPRQMIHAVFNQISDADTHKNVLHKADSFYKTVSAHVPFFNLPSRVMKTTRDNIYRSLQGIDKVNVPKTVRLNPRSPSDIYDSIKEEGFTYPVIFRQAGDHGGVSTIRVDDETEKFHVFALDGRDYYLTQFVDYADNTGIYSKYRLVVVDGEVYIRHVIFSDNWVVHSKSREYMEKHKKYQSQEAKILKSFNVKIKPKIKGVIHEIYQTLGLDYFGIDCHIDDNMNLLVFEINANMNVLVNNAKDRNNLWTKQIDTIKNALITMIQKAKI
jgi:glutathione synthase/RimK-type ligase-like ATP-grasp enzyme